jgi:hypothetical protein
MVETVAIGVSFAHVPDMGTLIFALAANPGAPVCATAIAACVDGGDSQRKRGKDGRELQHCQRCDDKVSMDVRVS